MARGSFPRFTTIGSTFAAIFVCQADLVGQVDTARARAVFDSTKALVARYEGQHGRMARVNGIDLHYLEWGDRRGVPLVWLHGSASTGYEIRHLAPRLVEAGYRVIAPDYRGHGRTKVADYDFTIYHIADDVVALLDRLRIRRAVVGGASKGGFIAAAVYDQYKDRVSGLLLADGGSWANQWIHDRQGIEAVKRQVSGSPPNVVSSSEFEVFLAVAGRVAGGPTPPPAERMLDLLVRVSQRTDGQWAFLDRFEDMMGTPDRFIAGASAPTTLPPLQWSQHVMMPLAVFRRVEIPVMVLDPQSARDDLAVTDQNERLAALRPQYVIHKVYPETGHNVAQGRPDWFVRDATELLARVRRGGSAGSR